MKRLLLIPLLVFALVLAACAGGGAAQTPGALGTDSGLGTETGIGTDTVTEEATAVTAPTTEPTEAVTEAATEAATAAATESPEAEATAETTGIVAAPYSMFTVAQLEGEVGAGTQEAGTPAAGATDTGTGAGTPQATSAAAGTDTGTDTETEDRLLVRASELLGSEIVDMNGDTVGNVEEILVDESGAIQYVVFDASGFLGVGGTGTGTGTDTGTQEAGTPAAAGTDAQGTGTQAAGTEVAGTPEGTAEAGTGTQPATEGEGVGVTADEDTMLVFNGTANELETSGIMLTDDVLSAEGPMIDASGADMPANLAELDGLLRVRNLTDTSVMNAQDEELGQVEEWIVDLEQGMLAYGVIDFGGFLGIAENTVAVPWEQFTVSAEAGAAADANLMLDVNQDTLENAPQLNMSEWQSWPNPIPMDWETETRTFWETAS